MQVAAVDAAESAGAQDESAVVGLAHTLWSAHYREDGVFVMLQYACYFDASREEKGEPLCVVAGYAAPVRHWDRFEVDWKIALAKHDVPYFRMADFAAKRSPFDGRRWEGEPYRASFLSTLANITKSAAIFGIGRLLPSGLFSREDLRFQLSERFNEYAVCGLECAVRSREYIRRLYSDSAPIEFIFDHGDLGRGRLEAEMSRCGLQQPVFRYSKPQPHKPDAVPTVQLQCCDFAAWELRKAHVTQGSPGFRMHRRSLLALRNDELNNWKRFTELAVFCEEHGVARRTPARGSGVRG